jgi:type I restriction enzyme S subunit
MEDVKEHLIYFNSIKIKKIEEVYSGYTYFREGDILLAKVTPCFENGKSGIAINLKNKIGFGSSEYHVLRSGENILSEVLYYIISSKKFINLGRKQLTGTGGLRRLPKDYVSNFKVPLAPIALQEEFASIVEQVEKVKNKLKNEKNDTDKLFNALMQKAFSGELA